MRITDGTHTVDVEVRIKVNAPANNAPSCFGGLTSATSVGGRYQVEAGEQNQGGVSCTDDENDDLSFTLLRQPANGGSVSAPQEQPSGGGSQIASFTHTAGQTLGDDSFAVRITDGTHTVDVEVRIKVIAPANNAPICSAGLSTQFQGGRYQVEAGAQTQGGISCTDDEGDDLSFTLLRQPANGGSVSAPQEGAGGGGQFATFTHTAGQTPGDDDFALRVTDGTHTVDVEVLIKVNAPGDGTAPETSIGSGPTGATADNDPSFGFSSSEPAGATLPVQARRSWGRDGQLCAIAHRRRRRTRTCRMAATRSR